MMNLTALKSLLHLSAKRWYVACVLCNIAVYLAGVFVIWTNFSPQVAMALVALLTVVSEFCIWKSDDYKGKADFVARRNEFKHSYGWKIEKSDLSDLLAELPKRFEDSLSSTEDEYFACKDAPGPLTAMRNLEESSWYSKHLAVQAAWVYGVIIIFLIIGSVASLIVSVNSVGANIMNLQAVSRIITSTILLVFSLGMVRLVFAFVNFGASASVAEMKSTHFISALKADYEESFLLLHDYQIARSSSPLIPEWIWHWKKEKLNRLWKNHRVQ